MTTVSQTDFSLTPSASARRGAQQYDKVDRLWFDDSAYDGMDSERMKDTTQCMIGTSQNIGLLSRTWFDAAVTELLERSGFTRDDFAILTETGQLDGFDQDDFFGFNAPHRSEIPDEKIDAVYDEVAPYMRDIHEGTYIYDVESQFSDAYFAALADAWTYEIEQRRRQRLVS